MFLGIRFTGSGLLRVHAPIGLRDTVRVFVPAIGVKRIDEIFHGRYDGDVAVALRRAAGVDENLGYLGWHERLCVHLAHDFEREDIPERLCVYCLSGVNAVSQRLRRLASLLRCVRTSTGVVQAGQAQPRSETECTE